MNYINNRAQILEILEHKGRVRPRELYRTLDIGPRAVFKQIKKLLEEGLLTKEGTAPNVFYIIKNDSASKITIGEIDPESLKIINENFYLIASSGKEMMGLPAFNTWCVQRKLEVGKTAKEYAISFKKLSAYKNDRDLIDGTEKIKKTFDKCYLDKLYYLDFYSIERFGKTKLGQMLLYAKQSQNRKLIKELVQVVKPKIEALAKNFDAVCYVPPTITREVQFMKELERGIELNLPVIKVTKIRGQIPIAQKTLSRLEDRIENAKRSVIIENPTHAQKVLIIDDAVGSGAMMNEVAKQLKDQKTTSKVVGLAITGSFKGFDVISEV